MPVRVGPQLLIADLFARAEAQGCEIRVSKMQLVTPWGTKHIRYIYNPKNNGRYDITDYQDDEFMLGSEIAAVSRRLGITLP